MAGVQHRAGVIFGLFLVLLVVAAGRTVYLGVLRGGTLRKAASNEQLSYETVSAPRGTITDRDGVDLAVSEPAQDISADPYLITDPLASRSGACAAARPDAVGRADEALRTHGLRVSRACAAGQGGAGGAGAEDRGRDGDAGDAPRVPARLACGTGARRGWDRRRAAWRASSTRATTSSPVALGSGV